MTLNNHKFDGVVAELQQQGLTVTVQSALNETWYVKGDDIYIGYIASGAEMLELKRTDQLNIRGIKSLGSRAATGCEQRTIASVEHPHRLLERMGVVAKPFTFDTSNFMHASWQERM